MERAEHCENILKTFFCNIGHRSRIRNRLESFSKLNNFTQSSKSSSITCSSCLYLRRQGIPKTSFRTKSKVRICAHTVFQNPINTKDNLLKKHTKDLSRNRIQTLVWLKSLFLSTKEYFG